ncbi:hypothetical protein H6F67_13100 [Microcoleus sp. FACHB-1515]|uniref:NUMOD3 domain-containing DNA-binding protein n=1 Tax=Cyanophyceae TaxID=3028117 RepID=UPI00168205C3|nr:NUMOD3 domain-containing DNA-binding protein [Microcoleus sp. FACHB-1515]MBD2090790.1 hypothetical protein [Microcoleus sp. FACHB-1515]
MDYKEITWTYESATYTLSNGVRYKPDFLLETGEYVEIKGVFNYAHDLPKIQQFKAEFKAEVIVIQEKDLRCLIKSTPFVFEQLRREWKSQAKVRGMDTSGQRNPMYGVTQSESTRAKIAAKAKARFQDPVFRAKFINSDRKRQYHESRKGIKTGPLVERVSLVCKFCGTEFSVTPGMARRKGKQFYSYTCSVNAQHGKTVTTDREIREQVLAFAVSHSEKIFSVKLNRLKPLFEPLYNSIAQQYGIIDIRTVCQTVVGKPCSRKNLLFFLRTYVENVRGTNANSEALELGDKKPLG